MRRAGFGLIYAMLVLVAISTLLVFALQFSTQAHDSTITEHAKIQLKLYEKSALELAILELQNSNTTTSRMLNERTFDGIYHFKIYATQLSDDINKYGAIYRLDLIGSVTPINWSEQIPHIITSRHVIKP